MLQVLLEALISYEFYKVYFVWLFLMYNISVMQPHNIFN